MGLKSSEEQYRVLTTEPYLQTLIIAFAVYFEVAFHYASGWSQTSELIQLSHLSTAPSISHPTCWCRPPCPASHSACVFPCWASPEPHFLFGFLPLRLLLPSSHGRHLLFWVTQCGASSCLVYSSSYHDLTYNSSLNCSLDTGTCWIHSSSCELLLQTSFFLFPWVSTSGTLYWVLTVYYFFPSENFNL